MMTHRLTVSYLLLGALTLAACGGGGGGGGVGPLPPGATDSIDTAGGTGGDNGGSGGAGGLVEIRKFGGTGPVEVLKSGSVDASFTATTASANLGVAGHVFTTDATVPLDPPVDPGMNEPYLLTGDTNLYLSDGDNILNNDPAVTGIRVDTGVSLTLPLNTGATTAQIIFANDVDNRGTIAAVDASATQRGAIDIQCDNYLGASGSALDMSGALDGQDGGSITVTAMAAFYNHGSVTAAGADHPAGNGGNGGVITLSAHNDLENTGAVSSSGGHGTGGIGGAGSSIALDTWNGDLFNSGALAVGGGDGDTGGDGDGIYLSTGIQAIVNGLGGAGAVRNSGALSASGGTGAAGNGGPGGLVRIYALGAGLLFDADINVKGGSASDGAFSGNGGWVAIYAFPGVDNADLTTPAGDLLLSGNISTTGGSAPATGSGAGGDGGQVTITLDASGSVLLGLPFVSGITPGGGPANPRLALRDLGSVNTAGGPGNTGGNGGAVNIVDNGEAWDGVFTLPYNFIDDPGGDVTNEVNITTRGGGVLTTAVTVPATGGMGGAVFLTTDTDPTMVNPTGEFLANSGDVDSSAGASLALAGVPGTNFGAVGFMATNDVGNSGALTVIGGNDLVDDGQITTGFGQEASEVVILSVQGTVTNTGAINASGGDGEAQGGHGALGISGAVGVLLSAGTDVSNSGNISVRGGDADLTVSGSHGGNGGLVHFNANTLSGGGSNTNTGSVDVSGGAGDTTGTAGQFTCLPASC